MRSLETQMQSALQELTFFSSGFQHLGFHVRMGALAAGDE